MIATCPIRCITETAGLLHAYIQLTKHNGCDFDQYDISNHSQCQEQQVFMDKLSNMCSTLVRSLRNTSKLGDHLIDHIFLIIYLIGFPVASLMMSHFLSLFDRYLSIFNSSWYRRYFTVRWVFGIQLAAFILLLFMVKSHYIQLQTHCSEMHPCFSFGLSNLFGIHHLLPHCLLDQSASIMFHDEKSFRAIQYQYNTHTKIRVDVTILLLKL